MVIISRFEKKKHKKYHQKKNYGKIIWSKAFTEENR